MLTNVPGGKVDEYQLKVNPEVPLETVIAEATPLAEMQEEGIMIAPAVEIIGFGLTEIVSGKNEKPVHKLLSVICTPYIPEVFVK